MIILAFESSAQAASVALSDNGEIIAEVWQRTGLTHSETLLPMAKNLLATAKVALSDIDLFSIANGPGSFTGLRIGVATVKGLALATGRPCVGISTLHALFLAHGSYPEQAVAVCVMDARVGQVYNALFEPSTGDRLTPDRAITLDTLGDELAAYNRPAYLIGDGAVIAYDALRGRVPVLLAPTDVRYQHARGVACAAALLIKDAYVTASALRTEYHRLPQAERERLERLKDVK
ncbi:MAG: tRNA (adenosine(37)-N6)-threonylcarbamoyltransferase complex dimerization subunit type 1 TsaB [Clostridiaceae bacterium]|nr:tRNA (adenosine(37)-N6)-threonylcarbamoyltransferase complex dimerization subunit type 1 TsaB [Clostridiaceae bacterium]